MGSNPEVRYASRVSFPAFYRPSDDAASRRRGARYRESDEDRVIIWRNAWHGMAGVACFLCIHAVHDERVGIVRVGSVVCLTTDWHASFGRRTTLARS